MSGKSDDPESTILSVGPKLSLTTAFEQEQMEIRSHRFGIKLPHH
jgi:hypothetical protein